MTKGRDQGPGREPRIGATVAGARANLDPKYVFGTDAEVENRMNTGYNNNPGTIPQNNAPSFKQIGPEASGRSANEPNIESREGSMKFSGGPREA